MKNIQLSARALITKDGKMLFIKNSEHPVYYLVGGTIEEGENSAETLTRELYEELGLNLEVGTIAFINERFLKINGKPHHEIIFYYLLKNCDDINIADGSSTDLINEKLYWLPIDKLTDYPVAPKFLKDRTFDHIDHPEHIISKEY